MDTQLTPAELQSNLGQFTGTEDYHRHWLGMYYTDGVQYLAEKAGAYWLIDAIASYQPKVAVRQEEFQVWTLRCLDDLFSSRSAVLTMDNGNDGPTIITQAIEYTDFPFDEIRLYLVKGSIDGKHINNILMLTSEY